MNPAPSGEYLNERLKQLHAMSYRDMQRYARIYAGIYMDTQMRLHRYAGIHRDMQHMQKLHRYAGVYRDTQRYTGIHKYIAITGVCDTEARSTWNDGLGHNTVASVVHNDSAKSVKVSLLHSFQHGHPMQVSFL